MSKGDRKIVENKPMIIPIVGYILIFFLLTTLSLQVLRCIDGMLPLYEFIGQAIAGCIALCFGIQIIQYGRGSNYIVAGLGWLGVGLGSLLAFTSLFESSNSKTIIHNPLLFFIAIVTICFYGTVVYRSKKQLIDKAFNNPLKLAQHQRVTLATLLILSIGVSFNFHTDDKFLERNRHHIQLEVYPVDSETNAPLHESTTYNIHFEESGFKNYSTSLLDNRASYEVRAYYPLKGTFNLRTNGYESISYPFIIESEKSARMFQVPMRQLVK